MVAKKIGYLGPEGTFSHEAVLLYSKKMSPGAEIIAFPTFHDILEAANREELDEAVVPIENSIEGTVGIVQDMLAKEVDLKIKNEVLLSVHHCLAVKKGAGLEDITEVISHPQPVEQCRGWLRKNIPQAKILLAPSTSDAAKQVSLSSKDTMAAICPVPRQNSMVSTCW